MENKKKPNLFDIDSNSEKEEQQPKPSTSKSYNPLSTKGKKKKTENKSDINSGSNSTRKALLQSTLSQFFQSKKTEQKEESDSGSETDWEPDDDNDNDGDVSFGEEQQVIELSDDDDDDDEKSKKTNKQTIIKSSDDNNKNNNISGTSGLVQNKRFLCPICGAETSVGTKANYGIQYMCKPCCTWASRHSHEFDKILSHKRCNGKCSTSRTSRKKVGSTCTYCKYCLLQKMLSNGLDRSRLGAFKKNMNYTVNKTNKTGTYPCGGIKCPLCHVVAQIPSLKKKYVDPETGEEKEYELVDQSKRHTCQSENVVYDIYCKHCLKSGQLIDYIGATSQTLAKRQRTRLTGLKTYIKVVDLIQNLKEKQSSLPENSPEFSKLESELKTQKHEEELILQRRSTNRLICEHFGMDQNHRDHLEDNFRVFVVQQVDGKPGDAETLLLRLLHPPLNDTHKENNDQHRPSSSASAPSASSTSAPSPSSLSSLAVPSPQSSSSTTSITSTINPAKRLKILWEKIQEKDREIKEKEKEKKELEEEFKKQLDTL